MIIETFLAIALYVGIGLLYGTIRLFIDVFWHRAYKDFSNYQQVISGRILLWPLSMFLSVLKKEIVELNETKDCDETWVVRVSDDNVVNGCTHIHGNITESHRCSLTKGHEERHKCACGAELLQEVK